MKKINIFLAVCLALGMFVVNTGLALEEKIEKKPIPKDIDPELKVELEKLVNSPDPAVRLDGAGNLAKLEGDSFSIVVDFLIEAMKDNAQVPNSANVVADEVAKMLINIGNPVIDPLLYSMDKKDTDTLYQQRIVNVLVEIGKKPGGIKEFAKHFENGGSKRRERIPEVVAQMGSPYVEEFVQLFTEKYEEKRTSLAVIMGVIIYGAIFIGLAYCLYIAYKKKKSENV